MIDVGKDFMEKKVYVLDLIDESKPEVQEFQKKMIAKYQRLATSVLNFSVTTR